MRLVRHDHLTALEKLLVRGHYAYADAYAEGAVEVADVLRESGFKDGECAQVKRLLEEEREDRL